MADDPNVPTQFGWDASDYDWQRGPMDLAAAARDGITFFTHKATEGATTRHRYYGEAMRRARDAGIPVLGAYHVVRTSPTIASQVQHMLSYLDSQTPWWRTHPCFFIQVDLELWEYDKVPASKGVEFADAIAAATGKAAVIYASRGQYGDQLANTMHMLWNANYGPNNEGHFRDLYAARGGDTGPGWTAYSGRTPVIWQYGSRTTIGSQDICDANAFRGPLADLMAVLNGGDDMDLGTPIPLPAYAYEELKGQTEAPYGELIGFLVARSVRAERQLAQMTADLAALKTGGVDLDALAAKVAAVMPKPPTAAEVAKAVNEDAAQRLRSAE